MTFADALGPDFAAEVRATQAILDAQIAAGRRWGVYAEDGRLVDDYPAEILAEYSRWDNEDATGRRYVVRPVGEETS